MEKNKNHHVILLNKLLQEVTDNKSWQIAEITFIVTNIHILYEGCIIGSIVAANRHYYFYNQKYTNIYVEWENPNLINILKTILTDIVNTDWGYRR